jgi:hypothetical protein
VWLAFEWCVLLLFGPTKRRASTALNGLLRGTSFRFTLYTLACTEEGTPERVYLV